MTELDERLVKAWKFAAVELGFEFVAPYHVLTPDHRRLSYLGLVRHFGGTVGTLVRVLQLGELSLREHIDDDFLVARVGERHSRYDEAVFRATLADWGWRGPAGLRPKWL